MTQIQTIEFINALRVSDNTKRSYARALHLFAKWAGKHLPDSQEEAQAFLDFRIGQGKAPSTIAIDASALERYLKSVNLPASLERPAVTLQPVHYLSKDQIKAMLDITEVDSYLQCLIALLYDSAARISEILALRVEDIDWRGFLKVKRKGGREDVANVSDWGMQYLRKWMDLRVGKHSLVFGGRPYRTVYGHMKAVAKLAEISYFKPHMLRHSRAVHLSEDTDLRWEEIGYQLGHVNPSITSRIYTRPKPEDLKKRIPAPSL